MPHDPLFDSAWLKWTQAIRHTQTLEAEIVAFGSNGDPYPRLVVRAEYHPHRHGFAVIPEWVEPIPVRWRLLLGDVANNFRSSLEHLAWALVTRGRTPPDTLNSNTRSNIHFPIGQHKNGFNGSLKSKLPGVRRADIAKVRRGQPYHYGARNRARHALTFLTDINNGDKHRAIQPIWTQPTSVGMEITHMEDCVLSSPTNRLKPQALEIGREMTLIRVRKRGPQPHIEVQPLITAEPTVGHRVSIKEWAAQCGIFVFRLLREFSEPPSEIHDVGAELVPLSSSETQ